jgi:hypothetical protein
VFVRSHLQTADRKHMVLSFPQLPPSSDPFLPSFLSFQSSTPFPSLSSISISTSSLSEHYIPLNFLLLHQTNHIPPLGCPPSLRRRSVQYPRTISSISASSIHPLQLQPLQTLQNPLHNLILSILLTPNPFNFTHRTAQTRFNRIFESSFSIPEIWC